MPAEFFLILAALFWGGTFVAIKLALVSVPPFLFISIRFWFAGMAILLLYRKVLFRKDIWKRSNILPALMTGTSALLGYAFQTIGLLDTTATQSGFITGAYVIFVPILQMVWERQFPSLRIWSAVFIVFLGLFLISQNHQENSLSLVNYTLSRGDLYTLIAAFFFAVYIILIDIYSPKVPGPILVSMEIFLIAILSSFALPFEQNIGKSWEKTNLDLYFWVGVVYTSLFATIFTLQIQVKFQKAVSPTKASILFALEPVFSFMYAYLLLGETLGIYGILGSVMIFLGIIITAFK
ncbi:permease [Leptospira ryugenii]|uniref:Permease n=1 Tax=Leptospira ryugenii TaxID=1917863 RepID=A0A2P2DZW8_9LEPT|nr:DMT family transporter [Leptospira ryugenii]GBF50160.1 permease [Leptospira ryugenii]